MKKIVLALTGLFVSLSLSAQTKITQLRTEYQFTPIGLEVETPRLSWQMESERYGAAQTAYRVVAARTGAELSKGAFIYDSGKVAGDRSISIPYGGRIEPMSRYYWKVFVWDERGESTASSATWFETGLMGRGWDGARWIGSHETVLSRYRNDFVIDFDVALPGGEAVFVFGAKDEKNYVAFGVDAQNKEIFLRHTFGGIQTEDARASIASAWDPVRAIHHVKLDVTSRSGKNYLVGVEIDGTAVTSGRPDNPAFGVNIDNGNPFSSADRLDYIGYDQPAGKKAEFSNITVSEKRWGSTFFSPGDKVVAEGFRIWSPAYTSAPMLRKSFAVKKGIARARLYATARGIYEREINGRKVGNDYYNPGWTVYSDRLFYNTFDITSLLAEGSNGIGATLGSGWWSDFVGMRTDPFGVTQSMMCKIVVEYLDGSADVIVSDGSWRVYDRGPVINNSMHTGQEYDARREVPGWTAGSFDDRAWKPVKLFDPPAPEVTIQAYVGETIKNNITLTAKQVTEVAKGVYIYDMGVNMVGIPRLLNLKGRAGQEVKLRFAEMLWPEVIPTDPVPPYTQEMYRKNRGQMYIDNYRGALSRDVYIMKGDPRGERFEPTLTQHGYRYVEVSGLDAPLALNDVQGVVLESIGQQYSWYETSNKEINQLFDNIVWGQRGNFLSVPTDCPQRNERLGWTGDAQVFALSSTYNMLTDAFFTRWLYSLRDSQGANGSFPSYAPGGDKGGSSMGWMEAGIIVPWQVYQQYGDIGLLETHYGSMVRYMDFLEKRAKDFIQPGSMYSDWLAVIRTPPMLINTAYFAYDAMIMEQVARALGKTDEAAKYARLYRDIKAAFNRTFVDSEGYTIDPGDPNDYAKHADRLGDFPPVDPLHPNRINTQTSYAVPLQFGLFEEKTKSAAAGHLAQLVRENGYRLTTGFIGTPYLCSVLSDNGHSDVAYRLFEQTEFPSWLFPVLQGATTIWERWNSYTILNGFGPVSMNSFNHYSYGAIEEWMMQHSLGIRRDPADPGYKHFFLEPEIGGSCSFIKGGFESMYGKIVSGWEKNTSGYIYRATVPANSTATLVLPAGAPSDVSVRKGAEGLSAPTFKDNKVSYTLEPGTYEFAVK